MPRRDWFSPQNLRAGALDAARNYSVPAAYLRRHGECLRSQEKQALKTVRFQRHLPLTIQNYTSCRISGVPPLQSDFSGLSSALKDDTNEPKKRKEARTKPAKMARKKSTLRTNTSTLLLHTLRTPTSATHSKGASLQPVTRRRSRPSENIPPGTGVA